MQRPNSQARQKQLSKLIEHKQRQLEGAPRGYLSISPAKGQPRYYHVIVGEGESRTYLSKTKDIKLIKQLAQKAYDTRVLKVAEQELKAWQALARFFPDMTVEEVFATLSPDRRKLVTPIRPSDEEYIQQWEAVPYEPGYFKPDAPYYTTDRGERVRSKSEQLIANLLNRLGIPYRYEYPLTIVVDGQRRTWRPDFLLLDVKNRRELTLEHFGLLGEEDYAANAIRKMRVYEENGLHEGTDILYSFESASEPLNIRHLENKLRRTLDL